MKQTNFHTHTSRCHHAFGNDEEFVRTAIQNGFEVLGFSDHACWKYDSDFVAHMRMKLDEFDDYKDSVLYLKDRYKKQIEIRFGLEAEYFPKYMDWLLDFCIENEIDYFGMYIFPEWSRGLIPNDIFDNEEINDDFTEDVEDTEEAVEDFDAEDIEE